VLKSGSVCVEKKGVEKRTAAAISTAIKAPPVKAGSAKPRV
jgi:hypothetical protein